MKRALFFPGQGSQCIGMGKDLAENFSIARAVFEEVEESLDQNLTSLMFEGPEEELNFTTNAQPALMSVSVAMFRVLETEIGLADALPIHYAAGHSLGEYSALTCAGTLHLKDSARLLRIRGEAMQKAVPLGDGAMAAILGLEYPVLQDILRSRAQSYPQAVCDIANDNGAGQVVISGHTLAIEQMIQVCKEAGAKRAIKLNVSAPFHSRLMAPAALIMQKALEETSFSLPRFPVLSNVSVLPLSQSAEIRAALVKQITDTVRWREIMDYILQQGVREVWELGSGKVLAGLMKRREPEVNVWNMHQSSDVEEAERRMR